MYQAINSAIDNALDNDPTAGKVNLIILTNPQTLVFLT